MNIPHTTIATYMNHQRSVLHPAINFEWKEFQAQNIASVQQNEKGITVGGDGRADTPGHNAKFGCYTMLDVEKSVVFDIKLVQVSLYSYLSRCSSQITDGYYKLCVNPQL
ncbi:hypothetical protein SNE40_020398 [Patella caerulea]|uniref:Uncharacterized protein n=1 Tax=Patella caerulea TaxID=87958 RepID=A0AAN8IZM6_PATCE